MRYREKCGPPTRFDDCLLAMFRAPTKSSCSSQRGLPPVTSMCGGGCRANGRRVSIDSIQVARPKTLRDQASTKAKCCTVRADIRPPAHVSCDSLAGVLLSPCASSTRGNFFAARTPAGRLLDLGGSSLLPTLVASTSTRQSWQSLAAFPWLLFAVWDIDTLPALSDPSPRAHSLAQPIAGTNTRHRPGLLPP